MRIWIDLSNSPHPLLFAPIARRLEERGHQIGVTARDNAQTAELTLQRWPTAVIVGGPSPRSRLRKAELMTQRVRELSRWARSFRATVALSHNSYGQIVAARHLGLRVVTAMDYEGQPANHLAFRLAHLILMPAALRESGVRRQGATGARVRFYDGFKEEIYLGDFTPDSTILDSLGVRPTDRPVVVVRTPPTRAAYHQSSNPLFGKVIRALGNTSRATMVVLARHAEEREAIRALHLPNLVMPDHAIDSRSLLYHADLVVGAGGTMTREAALMRIPTYSVFAGKRSAVDRALESQGYLCHLDDTVQISAITLRAADPRPLPALRTRGLHIVAAFTNAVEMHL